MYVKILVSFRLLEFFLEVSREHVDAMYASSVEQASLSQNIKQQNWMRQGR